MCSEGVCTDNDGASTLVGFEKGERLSGREQVATNSQTVPPLVILPQTGMRQVVKHTKAFQRGTRCNRSLANPEVNIYAFHEKYCARSIGSLQAQISLISWLVYSARLLPSSAEFEKSSRIRMASVILVLNIWRSGASKVLVLV